MKSGRGENSTSGYTIGTIAGGQLGQIDKPVPVDPIAEQAAAAESPFERFNLIALRTQRDPFSLEDHLPGSGVAAGTLLVRRPGKRLKRYSIIGHGNLSFNIRT
jgi:hypothetical protein